MCYWALCYKYIVQWISIIMCLSEGFNWNNFGFCYQSVLPPVASDAGFFYSEMKNVFNPLLDRVDFKMW